MRKEKRFSAEFKRQVVAELLNGMTDLQILSQRDRHMRKYECDYVTEDPGGAPL